MTMPSATKILRDEEFVQLDTLQEEGKELARKGKLYTNLVAEGAELLKGEAEKIFAELKSLANNVENLLKDSLIAMVFYYFLITGFCDGSSFFFVS